MSEQITITSAGGVEVKLDLVALGGRSFAFVMDWQIRLLLALVWFLVGMLIMSGGFVVKNPRIFSSGTSAFYFILLPALAIYFLYHPVLEVAMHGRTPGKRMAGIRIVSKNGGTASGGALLLRNVFRLIDSLPMFYVIGILVCLISKQHQRIGDMAAGTLLIYEEAPSKKRLGMLMDGQSTHQLSTQERELIAELLERWRELQPSKRREYAGKLLAKYGKSVSLNAKDRQDKRLRLQLQQLIK